MRVLLGELLGHVAPLFFGVAYALLQAGEVRFKRVDGRLGHLGATDEGCVGTLAKAPCPAVGKQVLLAVRRLSARSLSALGHHAESQLRGRVGRVGRVRAASLLRRLRGVRARPRHSSR